MRMEKLLLSMFDSWHQWKVCMLSGLKSAGWGVWRIVTCIVFGTLSTFRWIGCLIEAFARREPVAMLIVFILTACLSLGWFFTFVGSRAEIKSALWERDSVSVKLDMYMQAYEQGDIIVLKNDTIVK